MEQRLQQSSEVTGTTQTMYQVLRAIARSLTRHACVQSETSGGVGDRWLSASHRVPLFAKCVGSLTGGFDEPNRTLHVVNPRPNAGDDYCHIQHRGEVNLAD